MSQRISIERCEEANHPVDAPTRVAVERFTRDRQLFERSAAHIQHGLCGFFGGAGELAGLVLIPRDARGAVDSRDAAIVAQESDQRWDSRRGARAKPSDRKCSAGAFVRLARAK